MFHKITSKILLIKRSHAIFYAIVLLASILFLLIGNAVSGQAGIGALAQEQAHKVVQARVTHIISRTEDTFEFSIYDIATAVDIIFLAEITHGDLRGQIVTAEQSLGSLTMFEDKEVEVGDRILLGYGGDWTENYFFMNYVRFNTLVALAIIFFLLVVLFGGIKGFNALVSLGFIGAAIFVVLVPAILSGRNIYATTIIVSIFAILSTLCIVVGPNKKTLTAVLGCLGGVFLAGGLMAVMDIILGLTGMFDSETVALLMLPTQVPINLNAIIFASVIIGAVGAIMDVALSMSTSLWEIKLASDKPNFKTLFKSGVNIGRDILGTMLNTLVLAYLGSSLVLVLLLVANSNSFAELINWEMIIVEILRALVGSFGMLLTIPLTAGICAWAYTSASHGPRTVKFDNDE